MGTSTQSAAQAGARGARLLLDQQLEEAVIELEAARALAPGSSIPLRDLAVALMILGRDGEALEAIEAAMGLGDLDPEVAELRSVMLLKLGRIEEARGAASAANGFGADALAFALGDRSKREALADRLGEPGERSQVAALLLALDADAILDGARAERLARLAGRDPSLAFVPRPIRRTRWGGRVAATIDASTNPRLADRASLDDGVLGLGVLGEATGSLVLGPVRLDAGAFAETRHFFLGREGAEAFELSGLGFAVGVVAPLEASPLAPSATLGLRVVDVFGDFWSRHHAFSIEGGPGLVLPLSSELELLIEALAAATDFVDGSPPDAVVTSQNRDCIGQRVLATLSLAPGPVWARFSLAFIRNDARGAAFDAIGGLVAARAGVELLPGLEVSVDAGVEVLRYGAIGDPKVIGAASRRDELRLSVGSTFRLRITEGLAMIVTDDYAQKLARGPRGYVDNQTRAGLEVSF
ncbi:MAG: tetratricopeptide repeat protein [Deltaproteobacteria bacterium]|nr:tetratricopeptide repeat protein [Deltaproteobacteria bacterium]